MTNNLRKISQDLRTFAKRTKDFKYTDSALIVFLMTGMIFTAFNIFGASEDSGIKNQVTQINSSINQIRTDFKKARKENNKLVKDTTLELIQLTEQGDHVVKSPWSSWQYGINYFNNNWNGTYKGRGDKKEKYPYEGILERSTNPYERSVSPESKNYSLLSTSSNPRSASSNNRQGLSGYGIASFRKVNEPIVAFEVSAGINPRVFTAPTVTPLSATQPNLPQAINFKPVTPNITPPDAPNVNPPSITAPATGNDDDAWIADGSTYLKHDKGWTGSLGASATNGSSIVGAIAQQDMDGGKLTVTANGNTFDLEAKGIKFTGRYSHPTNPALNHNQQNNGAAVLDFTGRNANYYAVMKLVGGHTININSDIYYSGT